MPPKIASLVKFFEERHQQEQQDALQQQERSFSRARSQSPSVPHILTPPPAQRRRVSAPPVSTAGDALPLRVRRTQPRISDIASNAANKTPSSISTSGNTPLTTSPLSSTPLKTTAIPTSVQPAIVKDKAPLASPLESSDNAITNVEGRKAGQLIIDKLTSTSTPKKETTKDGESPSPIPIKERFKQRHPLLAGSSTPLAAQENHELLPISERYQVQPGSPENRELLPRLPSLAVYPGSATSLATLVEEPTSLNPVTMTRKKTPTICA